MKICIIASKLFTGGFTTSMLNMIHQLNENNVEVHVLFLEPESQQLDVNSLLDGISYQNIELVNNPATFQNRIRLLKNRIDIKNTSAKQDVRLVQLKLLNRVLSRMPYMDMMEYDAVISWEENLCNDFLAYNVKAKKKIGYIHPDYEATGFDTSVDYDVLSKLDYVVTVSNYNKEILQKKFPDLKDKIRYIPNVLNIEKIEEIKNEYQAFEKSDFDIVSVGRILIQNKGFDRLLRVCRRLQQEGFQFQLYIVGGGGELSKLKDMVIEPYIHVVGEKTNPYPYMNSADLMVLFSLKEGKPMVIDEAMYLSTPCLVTNYSSASEQIQHQTNGWICEMNDEDAYNQLKYILEHREEYSMIKENLENEDKNRYINIERFLEVLQ